MASAKVIGESSRYQRGFLRRADNRLEHTAKRIYRGSYIVRIRDKIAD